MLQPRPVHYPESDGLPMAETEEHAEAMIDLFQTVRRWLGDPERWHVFGNQYFYYEEGNVHKAFSPDVYVLRGVPQLPRRRIWKLWEAPGAVPALVIELTSASSVSYDLGRTRELYEALGVEEYVVFDVLRDATRAPIRVWRRQVGGLVEGPADRSEVLGVRLEAQTWRLRLAAPDGSYVPNDRELAEQQSQLAEQQSQRAEREARRADAEAEQRRRAEAELQNALAELERLRREGQGPHQNK